MKRIILLFVVVFFCLSVSACGTNDNDGNGIGGKQTALKASALSIDDFEWETTRTKYNGTDCYSFSLTNNSNYDIISVEFTYKVKDDVNDSDLSVYTEFMNDHDSYIEEDDSPRDVTLRGNKNSLVAKGDVLTGLRFTIGFKDWAWYDYPTEEQFKLMEPKEMEIGVIGKDNFLYIAYYDFEDGTWILDEDKKAVDTWSKKEIAQKISKPNEGHHVVVTDNTDEFEAYSFGVKSDDYSQYVSSLIEAGFEEQDSGSSYFEGKNADGYIVELWYYSDEERLSIGITNES